jgi:hypothetical protein
MEHRDLDDEMGAFDLLMVIVFAITILGLMTLGLQIIG